MNAQITFLFYVDEKYVKFILPFLAFALVFHPTDVFEIHIVSKTIYQFPNYLNIGLEKLKQKYKNSLIIIKNTISTIKPQYLRYLNEPIFKSKYTYIGDIDILICENILGFHTKFLNDYNSIISNNIRKPAKRLTGLHFVLTNEYYSKTLLIRAELKKSKSLIGDETMLYDICKNIFSKEFLQLPYDMDLYRPQHGQHLSLNRKPFLKSSPMSVEYKNEYKENFLKLINDSFILDLINLNNEYKQIFNTYLNFIGLKS